MNLLKFPLHLTTQPQRCTCSLIDSVYSVKHCNTFMWWQSKGHYHATTSRLVFFPSLLELTIAMQGSTFHRSPTSHISYGNFRRDAFHYLQAENLTSVMVENESECIFLCVEETKCYSLNLAVYPDSKGLHLCELLATDKYKAAKHFLANDTFHHHRPWVSNIGRANLRINLRIQ